ncbi:MAG TPA: hypothetical protein V6C85_00040 [Allocoleopsis sp.]
MYENLFNSDKSKLICDRDKLGKVSIFLAGGENWQLGRGGKRHEFLYRFFTFQA